MRRNHNQNPGRPWVYLKTDCSHIYFRTLTPRWSFGSTQEAKYPGFRASENPEAAVQSSGVTNRSLWRMGCQGGGTSPSPQPVSGAGSGGEAVEEMAFRHTHTRLSAFWRPPEHACAGPARTLEETWGGDVGHAREQVLAGPAYLVAYFFQLSHLASWPGLNWLSGMF